MDSIILYRTGRGHVDFIRAENGLDIEVFPNMERAIEYAQNSRLLAAVPYQIVECDEL